MSQDPYKKLRNVIEQAENAKTLQLEAETRLEEARRIEADALDKVNECVEKAKETGEKINEMQKLIAELKTAETQSSAEFRNRQGKVERERELLRSYLNELNSKIKQVIHDREASDACIKELEGKNVDLLRNLDHFKMQHESIRREIEAEKVKVFAEMQDRRRKHDEDMLKEKEKIKVELELQKKKEKEEIERLKGEKNAFEEELTEQKKTLERQIEQLGESKKKELEAKLEEQKRLAEIELEKRKKTIVGELEKVKAEAAKKEMELEDLLSRAAEAIRERDAKLDLLESKVKYMESDYEKQKEVAEKALGEKDAMNADYELALRSREALLSEMAQLKNRG